MHEDIYEERNYQRPSGEPAKDYPHNREGRDLLTNLKESDEIIQKDIDIFTNLAKKYYASQDNMDYTEHTGEAVQYAPATLCTLIKYHNRNVIIDLGSGKFNEAVFTTVFTESPLPLFLLQGGEGDLNKEKNPIMYLNDHTMLYSPKGGEVSQHTPGTDIDHTHGKIQHYPQAIESLKNAYIDSKFATSKDKEQFIDIMKEIRGLSPENLEKRMDHKESYYHDKDSRELHKKIKTLLEDAGADQYELVKSFNPKSQKFTSLANAYE